MKTLHFIKTVIFVLLLSSVVFSQSNLYLQVMEKDTFYFILSNDKLLELSSSGDSKFYYVDEIIGNFSASTLFNINSHQLLLVNNNTITVYSINAEGHFQQRSSRPDIWGITGVDPWENDFMVKTNNSLFKLLTCTGDSIYMKNDSITTYS